VINLEPLKERQDISIVIGGSAGQGLATIERLCADLLKRSGYFVFSTQELMSRIRGGTNTVEVRFSSRPCFAFVNRIDLLIALNKNVLAHIKHRITDQTIIISAFEQQSALTHVMHFPFFALAKDMGSEIYINSIVLGVVSYLFHLSMEVLETTLHEYFKVKSQSLKSNNILASQKGFNEAKKTWSNSSFQLPSVKDKTALDSTVLMNASQAIASGAIAGGCNFVCAYPMSPGTSVLVNLAKKSHQYHIGIEQVEDEIAAANMAIGAWYAGGRALVTTSGGGFALMCEAVSLSGMTETPLLIVIGQRPGPATGLPTRTEQGDLNCVLHAGHGEFPRLIFAPGNLQEAFDITKHAFEMADKFQVPTIILSDQYGLDSYYTADPVHEKFETVSPHIVKTTSDYQRFAVTDSGISPRGIPGYGEGIVCADSDEHTEEGYITEDFSVRQIMQDKRMKKLIKMTEEALLPTFYGEKEYDHLVVCWGTNYHVVKESVMYLNQSGECARYAMLHFGQVYPLHASVRDYLKSDHTLIALENNGMHQFASLVEASFDVKFDHYILKYNGMPFAVEDVIQQLNNVIKGESDV
jgi:2-oxoglutarate ferredoxin oxidoreductase subunit alpha